MSLPSTIPATGLTGPANDPAPPGSYARLIPGSQRLQDRRPVQTRKQPRSLQDDRSVKAEAAPGRTAVSRPDPLRSISSWLPRPDAVDSTTSLAPWVICDIAVFLIASIAISYAQWFLADGMRVPVAATTYSSALGVALLQGALVTLIACTEGVYRIDPRGVSVALRLGKSVLWSTALIGIACREQHLSLLSLCAGLGYLGLLGTRSLSRLERETTTDPARSRKVLIVGANQEGRALAAYLATNPQVGKTACGFLDDYWPVGDEVLGRVADLERLARAHFVDQLIIASDDPATRRRAIRMARLCHLDVVLVPNLVDCTAGHIAQVGRWPLITLYEEHLPVAALVIKRAIDLIGASVGLLLTAPLFAAIALLIKRDSPGPSVYAAPRVGRKGAHFCCYKFRTMFVNADAIKQHLRVLNQREGPFFKIESDPRITRCGRWLRKYSLDELPQLWNVLRGEMSLVGPRPHPVDDFARYQLTDFCRLDVRPGMTGLWQTTARRDPSFQTNIRLDREYIQRWSLALDLRILIKTIRVVFAGGGC